MKPALLRRAREAQRRKATPLPTAPSPARRVCVVPFFVVFGSGRLTVLAHSHRYVYLFLRTWFSFFFSSSFLFFSRQTFIPGWFSPSSGALLGTTFNTVLLGGDSVFVHLTYLHVGSVPEAGLPRTTFSVDDSFLSAL